MASELESALLIRTKLHRPSVPLDVVGRDRLFELMERASDAPLTLVSAPAGYGKSVLVARWAARCEDRVAWLSLDRDESDIRLFLQYLVAAIQTIAAGACPVTEDVLSAPELPPASMLAGYLINELEAMNQPLVIALDDYHRIDSSSPVHEFMNRLFEHPPRSVRLVLITRRDPPLNLTNLLAGNLVTEVRLGDLRFTKPETARFLASTADLVVSDNALANVQEQVEGWAAGLRLVALALRHAADPESLLKGLHGGLPQTRAYLLREALSGLPPEEQDYLLRSSILDRFCPRLLEAVCSLETSSASQCLTGRGFLHVIQTKNLFAISLDANGEWFRYHHLFQELLQRQLEETAGTDEIRALHLRAVEWFETEGLIEEAIKHALAAEDIERAARLVENNRQSAVNADRWYALDSWIGRLPESIVQERAELLMARVWVLSHHSRFDSVFPMLDRIETLLEDGPDHEILRGEIALFRGYVLFFLGDGAGSLSYIEQALERIPITYEEARAQSEVIFGLASQMVGRGEQALRFLADLVARYDSPTDLRKTRQVVTIVMIQLISGNLSAADAANRRLRAIAKAGGYSYATAWSDYLGGLIHLVRWELDAAVEYLERSVASRFIHFQRAAVDSLAALMMAHQVQGRRDEVQSTIQMLQEFSASLEDPAYSAFADSARARLAILEGQPTSALDWLETIVQPEIDAMLWWFEVPLVTRCRAMIAEGSPTSLEQARIQLQKVVSLNEDRHNTLHLVNALALLAVASNACGMTEEALGSLERAVTLAQPGGMVFPFVEAGTSMAVMLERLQETDPENDFIRHLLTAFADLPEAPPARKPASSDSHASVADGSFAIDALTNRELDVLELLAERFQNKEIASRLGVSTHTVSYHLKSIYGKLGINSRRQAVATAIDRGLLKRR